MHEELNTVGVIKQKIRNIRHCFLIGDLIILNPDYIASIGSYYCYGMCNHGTGEVVQYVSTEDIDILGEL